MSAQYDMLLVRAHQSEVQMEIINKKGKLNDNEVARRLLKYLCIQMATGELVVQFHS